MSSRSTDPGPGNDEGVVLAFENCGDGEVSICWVDYEGSEVQYATLQPRCSYNQGARHPIRPLTSSPCRSAVTGRSPAPPPAATFTTHPWRVKSSADDITLAEYMGGGATVTINADGSASVQPGLQRSQPSAPTPHPTDPAAGLFRQRGAARGMAIFAYDCVDERAVRVAADTLRHMLADVGDAVVAQLVALCCSLAIIGRRQRTTDIPAHAYLRGGDTEDGRDYDEGTRGLGGSVANPVTSVGEPSYVRHLLVPTVGGD